MSVCFVCCVFVLVVKDNILHCIVKDNILHCIVPNLIPGMHNEHVVQYCRRVYYLSSQLVFDRDGVQQATEAALPNAEHLRLGYVCAESTINDYSPVITGNG